MKAETSLPCGEEICQEVTTATESLSPSHSTCFLGPASPAKRVKPSRLPAAELLWLLVLDKNIDFLWCCAMHVRWTGVISSHALRRRGDGASSAALCSHLLHTPKVYCRRFLCSISLLLLFFLNVSFASVVVHLTAALSSS